MIEIKHKATGKVLLQVDVDTLKGARGILYGVDVEGADRPLAIVKVEHRIDFNQVHIGLVISVQRADVAPIRGRLAVLVAEAVTINLV